MSSNLQSLVRNLDASEQVGLNVGVWKTSPRKPRPAALRSRGYGVPLSTARTSWNGGCQ
jgi:hypothetical protein